jgi:thiamine transport system ATP-binding protein
LLEVHNLTVRFGDITAVDDLSLTVRTGEMVCVLGPSGCGKSTLLRVIAGLEEPAAGTVRWEGEDITRLPVHRRGFGLMFQDYALFPHRSVAANVAFGLRMQGLAKTEIQRRVEDVLGRVGLAGMGDRGTGQLSGGQQQRVALARAIAPSPKLLMFDEPLGSLDRSLRERLVIELNEVLSELGITALYVTHDQEEALALADQVMVMNRGRVEQIGSPQEIWSHPRNEFAARFLGFNNLVRPQEARRLGWPVPEGPADGYVVYRPDGFGIDPDGPFSGVVQSLTYRGDHFLIKLHSEGDISLQVVVRWQPVPAVNDALRLSVDPSAVFAVHP